MQGKFVANTPLYLKVNRSSFAIIDILTGHSRPLFILFFFFTSLFPMSNWLLIIYFENYQISVRDCKWEYASFIFRNLLLLNHAKSILLRLSVRSLEYWILYTATSRHAMKQLRKVNIVLYVRGLLFSASFLQ